MHISIIDDEKLLANKVMKKLEKHGYSTSAYYSYHDFMKNGGINSGLYIVDLALGDGTGFDIIQYLREEKNLKTPIMIISSFGDSENIIHGLEIGADDYLTKPIAPDELLARVRAILRRPATLQIGMIYHYKNISYNSDSKETKVGDRKVYLTKNESLVLELFITNIGKTITREKLIMGVWGGNHYANVSDNTINVTLSKVRKKLGEQFILKTLYNYGYLLEA